MMPKGAIAQGTIRTSLVLGLRIFVQAGNLLLVARILGPDWFGPFTGVTALAVSLGAVATFGMPLLLFTVVAANPGRRDAVLARALPVSAISGVLLLALFLMICLTVLKNLTFPFLVLLAVGISEILVLPWLALSAWDLTARGMPARSQMVGIVPLTIRLALVAAILILAPKDPLTAVALAYLFGSILGLGCVIVLRQLSWVAPTRWKLPNRAQWKASAGYAALNATTMGSAELDKTLAARLLPPVESGIYAAAQRTVNAITMPVSAMLLAAMPRLSQGHKDLSSRPALQNTVLLLSAAYGVALAIILWLLSPQIELLFGGQFTGLRQALQWFCLAIPAFSLRLSSGHILVAYNLPWVRIKVEIFGLLVLGATALALTTAFGRMGMIFAFTFAETSMAALSIFLLAKARGSRLEGPTQL